MIIYLDKVLSEKGVIILKVKNKFKFFENKF